MSERTPLSILLAIEGRLGRVEGGQDGIKHQLEDLGDRIEAHFADDARRFGVLEQHDAARLADDRARGHGERRRAGVTAALVASVIGAVGQALQLLLLHWFGGGNR
jgi:hypothetical protein